MAVKINRQMNSVALLGVPTSAASLKPGHERGPAAWRAAGLAERLREAGFTVTDHGDCAERTFAPDDEHPRARNVKQVLAVLEELRPKVEVAVKSGALPLVLGGDDSIVLATIAGCRRYYRNVGLIYLDRDAGLNEPATTPSGCVDGMVISHVVGRGAPELVRFWGEPPLVREPEIALLGIDRLDEPEQQYPVAFPAAAISCERNQPQRARRRPPRKRSSACTDSRSEFVLHIDLDVIASEDFPATNLSAPGGMRWQELREALAVLARQPKLAALVISAYNPALDAEGAAARRFIDLLTKTLALRMAPPAESATAEHTPAPAAGEPAAISPDGQGTATSENPSTAEDSQSDTAAS